MRSNHMKKTSLQLLFINAFIYISMSLYAPFLSAYYTKTGISAVQIGILLTIGPLVAILIQPLWAVLSDKTGKRKDVLSLVVLGSALSMLCYYIGHTFLAFFLASLLLAVFTTSIVPLSDAIILHYVHKFQLDFSKIRMGGTVGYAFVVILSGIIIKQKPEYMFFMGFIGYLMLLFFVRRLSYEDEKVIGSGNQLSNEDDKVVGSGNQLSNEDDKVIGSANRINKIKLSLKERFSIAAIFESNEILFLLAFAFINQVGLSFNYTFLGVYMTDLGLGEGMIGLINSVSAFSEIPVLFLINRICRKISTLKITVTACILLGLRILIVTGEALPLLILSQSLHGLTYMTVYYSCAVYINNHVKPENKSKGQSILAIVQVGIGSIAGNIAGGYLVDALGLKPAYYSMTVLILAVTVLTLLFLKIYQRRSPVTKTK